jgi:hypothetical protein
MMQARVAGCRGFLVLGAFVALAGCAKREEAEPGSSVPGGPSAAVMNRLAKQLELPAQLGSALQELDGLLQPLEAREGAGIDDAALALLAERTVPSLLVAYPAAPVAGGERFGIIDVLRRLGTHARDSAMRQQIVQAAFLPCLAGFAGCGDDPVQAAAAVEGLIEMIVPPGGIDPSFGPEGVLAATAALEGVARSIRERWGCTDWRSRPPAAAATGRPAVGPTELLVNVIRAVVRLLDRSQVDDAQASGVAVLATAIRESTVIQDPAAHAAAADAVAQLARRLTPASVRELATALVEALFAGEETGDGLVAHPAARRALGQLVAGNAGNRDVAVEELLKALALELEPEAAAAFPLLAALGRNERLDLLRLPCGGRLGAVCTEEQAALVAWRDQPGATAEQAACNAGRKPDDAPFRAGFARGVIWDRVTRALVDILPRQPAGAAPDLATRKGLAVEILRAQLRATVAWTEQVDAARTAGAKADLDRLYDTAGGSLAVTLRWWRTIAAARALSLLGVNGPEDETLKDVLRLGRFLIDWGSGFRLPPESSWPAVALDSGRPGVPAAWPTDALFDSLASYELSSPEVVTFLLHVLGAEGLTEALDAAVIRSARWGGTSARVPEARAAAVRALQRLLRADMVDFQANLDRLRFLLEELQPLFALQEGTAGDRTFQLYPPTVARGTEPSRRRASSESDWTVPPERPDDFDFASYKDALISCAWRPHENAAHVAKWQSEMSAEQRVQYCKKWVEPFASWYEKEMKDVELEQLQLADERCWAPVAEWDAARFRFCDDKQAGREPATDLGLSNKDCEEVVRREQERVFCEEFRFLPNYPVQGRPSLWSCYDKFPLLRAAEPIGPVCPHPAARILAAYLYVKLRSQAGTRTRDDVTFESLEAILPLRGYLAFVHAFGETPDAAVLEQIDRLTRELAKVEFDLPVFRGPPSPTVAVSRRTERRPEELTVPDLVSVPWYRRDGMFSRPRLNFADLRADFLEACGAPPEVAAPAAPPAAPPADGAEAEAAPQPTTCAADGGPLRDLMRFTTADGAPGPLQAEAFALAHLVFGEGLPGLFDAPVVIADLDARCLVNGNYALPCLHDAVMQEGPGGFAARERALYLLTALGNRDRVLAEKALIEFVPLAEADTRLREPLAFAFIRLRPVCTGEPGGPCDPEHGCPSDRCDRVRLLGPPLATPPAPPTSAPAPTPATTPATASADAGTATAPPPAAAADAPPTP